MRWRDRQVRGVYSNQCIYSIIHSPAANNWFDIMVIYKKNFAFFAAISLLIVQQVTSISQLDKGNLETIQRSRQTQACRTCKAFPLQLPIGNRSCAVCLPLKNVIASRARIWDKLQISISCLSIVTSTMSRLYTAAWLLLVPCIMTLGEWSNLASKMQ